MNTPSDDWYPTDDELKNLRPISEIDPNLLHLYKSGKMGRPKIANKKQVVSLRLDPDVIEAWRASGANWQSRINEVLRIHAPH
ncbi:MAG: hypothetical protein EAZ74_02600 [Alphaproteobacteria bacterium]|nr:MAG: hypothetical protein EAY76_04790 [Alphaproteobacteria bacterium]TAF15057.1 MAG: hypothetical protein EAZ74_02600 [Alphaproteobacteria bacterium]TAF40463.1 MAG: hypothetical protein EAZ66_02970 [Alphaproteobacteria bacterium]TAF76894.1 MAG: hypothetical protein EAZ52_01890 [Alphaproteobacteria bacterium]